ncbi:MAG: hypothetical protein IT329_08545 [Caldilineaceae bacterium]|nr:hypothetical protein [Caldilineaceae bacterium]
MRVSEAKAVARRWVIEEGSRTPGFVGAYFAGSITWLPDDAPLPETSDVDVMLVVEGPLPPHKLGKFVYDCVLLEVTYLPQTQVQTPEQVLGDYHLAGSFRAPNVIADPAGHLTRLQAAVGQGFARRVWVERRCAQAAQRIVERLDSIDPSAPLQNQVMAWLFAAGGAPHVLLAAGLRNPTVRRRYVAAHDLLADFELLDCYPPLLDLLGCEHLSREQVTAQLPTLEAAFDDAARVVQPSYPFAADLSEQGRAVAIGGSRQLIQSGWHREAVFWMVATYSRCRQVFAQGAPEEMRARHTPGYRALLALLGIAAAGDLVQRGEQVRAFLPRLQAMADDVLAANPDIQA